MESLFPTSGQYAPRYHFTFIVMALLAMTFGCDATSGSSSDFSSNVDAAALVQVTDQTFNQDVLDYDHPVVVLMSTHWCPECGKARPTLCELSSNLKGKVRFREVDAERNPFLSQKYQVTQYPTLIIFIDGQETHRLTGTKELATLKQLLAVE
ncbi:hypothetical protein GC197_02705 [bacterium]|nr:hypothetical protein [bacterium]